ncbi:hypothetical protein [Sphingopyxis sp.]|uniref:hypothetical protein n=1 Tax=Sphingopyxis sp. TaxID=1908224 RepID=UPI0035AD98DB
MNQHIKLSLYLVNQAAPAFSFAGCARVKLRQKEGTNEKRTLRPLGRGGNSARDWQFYGIDLGSMPVDQFNREGYSHMKKSITLSLVLAATMGLAACGEKAADNAATTETPAPEATTEGAADGAMQAAEGAADAAATAKDAATDAGAAAAAGDTAAATDKAAEAAGAAKEATDQAKAAVDAAKK